MTALTMPTGRRSLIGKVGEALRERSRARGKTSRLAAMITTARQHVMTAAALAAMDFGAFGTWHHGGWFVLGASLLALHFDVSG